MDRYFGFDLGDAESAVSRLTKEEGGSPEMLTIRDAKSLITAYAQLTDGTLVVGESACYVPKAVRREIRFKTRFLTDPESAGHVKRFASGVLGDGVGVQPSDELVVAPFDGEISSVAESQHAVGVDANDMSVLIHVGVDTVKMNGDGFTCLVKEGDQVKAGQPLIRFDRAKIKAAGFSDTVAVLLTNSDDLDGVEYGAK